MIIDDCHRYPIIKIQVLYYMVCARSKEAGALLVVCSSPSAQSATAEEQHL